MKIIRGDTKRYQFKRADGDGDTVVERPYGLYFTVKRVWTDEDFIFQKTIDDMEFDDDETSETYGFWSFVIRPTDTDGVDYGRYVCDIQVVRDEDSLEKTTIYKDRFTILDESTWAVNENGGA